MKTKYEKRIFDVTVQMLREHAGYGTPFELDEFIFDGGPIRPRCPFRRKADLKRYFKKQKNEFQLRGLHVYELPNGEWVAVNLPEGGDIAEAIQSVADSHLKAAAKLIKLLHDVTERQLTEAGATE